MKLFLKMLLSPFSLIGAVCLVAAAVLLPTFGFHVQPTRHIAAVAFLVLIASVLLAGVATRFSVRRHLPHIHGLAACAIILLVSACSSAQIQQAEAALSGPAAQSLILGLENFSPAIKAIIAKADAGVASTAADKQMVCGAMSWADGLFKLAAPIAGITTSAQATETAAMVGVNSACASTTTDVASAVSTVLTAYLQTVAALQTASVVPAS